MANKREEQSNHEKKEGKMISKSIEDKKWKEKEFERKKWTK